MARMVLCRVLKREAPGLEEVPYPGDIGQRIFEEISHEGWRRLLEQLAVIMNDNHLSSADPASLSLIEQHMLGFLFNEGGSGELPGGFTPPGRKK